MYAEIQYDIDYSARKIYYHDFNYMTMCVYSTDESEDMWDKMPIRDLGFSSLWLYVHIVCTSTMKRNVLRIEFINSILSPFS